MRRQFFLGLHLTFFFLPFLLNGQSFPLIFRAGLTYGGPVPVKSIPKTSGVPGIHGSLGVAARIRLSDFFLLETELSYTTMSVNYSQDYTKDTLVKIIVLGKDNYVPTYYNGHAEGRLLVHNIKLSIPVVYQISESIYAGFGPYFSYTVQGQDTGNVLIRVGEGGFFDDFYQYFNNFKQVNRFDAGLVLSFHKLFFNKLDLGFHANRSLIPFYRKGTFSDRGLEDVNMYNTSIVVFLGWKIL
jgi:hypothetical protein